MTVDYVIIGHICADIVPDGFTLGGTCSYCARTAQAFGLQVGVLTSAVKNEPLLDELAQYAEVVNIPAEHNTVYANIYEPEGRIQYLRSVAAPLTVADVPEVWHSAPFVHIAPMADEIAPDVIDVFGEAHRRLLTPQGWMRDTDSDQRVLFKSWFDENILKNTDLLVLSDEDIVGDPGLVQRYAAAVPYCVKTSGYHGGTYYINGDPFSYDAVKTQETDPTGAGDIFAASLFAAWNTLNDFDAAIRVAAKLAALSITRHGLEGTPSPQEVQAALGAHKP